MRILGHHYAPNYRWGRSKCCQRGNERLLAVRLGPRSGVSEPIHSTKTAACPRAGDGPVKRGMWTGKQAPSSLGSGALHDRQAGESSPLGPQGSS